MIKQKSPFFSSPCVYTCMYLMRTLYVLYVAQCIIIKMEISNKTIFQPHACTSHLTFFVPLRTTLSLPFAFHTSPPATSFPRTIPWSSLFSSSAKYALIWNSNYGHAKRLKSVMERLLWWKEKKKNAPISLGADGGALKPFTWITTSLYMHVPCAVCVWVWVCLGVGSLNLTWCACWCTYMWGSLHSCMVWKWIKQSCNLLKFILPWNV